MSLTASHAAIFFIIRNFSVPQRKIPTFCAVKEKVAKTRREHDASVKGLSSIRSSSLGTLTAGYCQVVCGYHLDAGLSKCIHISNGWFEERKI